VSIARRWVFPIIRILIFAAIAAALVKIAFFADPVSTDGDKEPTGQIVEPQVPVTVGTISNDIVLDGTVSPAPGTSIVPSMSGEVRSVAKKNGDTVKKGDELAQIRAVTFDDNGTSSTRWLILKAPASGKLSGLVLFVGESVGAGSAVGKVTPSTFRVTANIPPAELYRLVEQPETATVTVNGGPAPFECASLRILAPDAEQADAQTTMRCTVPGDVRVFAGLTAEVVIAGGIAENVLVVPMTAVLGSADTGVVYVMLPDGSTEERSVVLGMNDGVSVEIREGLAEGELILEFVPGAPAGGGGGIDEPFPIGGPVIIEDGEVIGQGG